MKPAPSPKPGSTYVFKIVLLGDGAVGKTNLRKRYMGDHFTAEYIATVGADFAYYSTTVEHDGVVDTYKFSIWDLAGQPKFSSVRPVFYAGAFGALICFDVTRENTFEHLNKWVEELIRHSHTEGTPIVVVANKMDLYDPNIHMDLGKVEEYIKEIEERLDHRFRVGYIETSALTGLNVKKAFEMLREYIMEWISNE